MTRDELLRIVERSIVPQVVWRNRDSANAIMQAGQLGALLMAGCDYHVTTTDMTIWIEVTYEGFNYFETGRMEIETFYLPTVKRLDETAGQDWY